MSEFFDQEKTQDFLFELIRINTYFYQTKIFLFTKLVQNKCNFRREKMKTYVLPSIEIFYRFSSLNQFDSHNKILVDKSICHNTIPN